ncbi:MAG TPA: NAD(+)/NADH kinase [Polyangiaceae bacterium]
MSAPRVVVVAKRTAYQRFIEDERDPRAKLLLRRRAPVVASWLDAHGEHSRTVDEVERALERAGAKMMLVRRAHAAFDASDAALVIAVGGDGTLLAASHNVSDTPILGVNSAPRHSVGFFCALERKTFRRGLAAALEERLPSVELTRMSVLVNGRIRSNRILNDALCAHSSPAATSRYIIQHGRVREEQRSSGFWIGPAAGSTAAQSSAGGRVLPLGSKKLQLVVREPYVPAGERYRLVRVLVGPTESIRVESKMDDACVFLDGPYRQVPVRLGDELTFRASDEPLLLLGLKERRRR